MTKEDLIALKHLSINEEVEGKFYHMHVATGYMLTYWKDGDPIEHYSGFECIYMPISENYPDMTVITKKKHDELSALHDEAVAKAREAELQARQSEAAPEA